MPLPSTLNLHNYIDLVAPILFAMICGAVIGVERTRTGAAAGVRTFSMVCFISAVLVAILNQPHLWSVNLGARGIGPTRGIQGVLAGIGFLCGA